MGLIFGNRQRIDDAAADEGHAILALHPGMLFDEPDRQRMRPAGQEARVEQRGDVLHLRGPITDTARGSLHLDQGFEPEHSTRAVSHDLDLLAARGGLLGDGGGEAVGAHRDGRHIQRDVDLRHLPFASSTKASSVSASTNPTGSLS